MRFDQSIELFLTKLRKMNTRRDEYAECWRFEEGLREKSRAFLRTQPDGSRRIPEKSASSSAKREIKRETRGLECRARRVWRDVACVLCTRVDASFLSEERERERKSSCSLFLYRAYSGELFEDFGRRAESVIRQPRKRRLIFHASITSLEEKTETSLLAEARAVFLVAIATGRENGEHSSWQRLRNQSTREYGRRDARNSLLVPHTGPRSFGSAYLPSRQWHSGRNILIYLKKYLIY